MKFVSYLACCLLVVATTCSAFNLPSSSAAVEKTAAATAAAVASNRRAFMEKTLVVAVGGLLASTGTASPALASGGATAGKYTTIPIAKRRYYGRVQAAVREFLLIGPDVVKGDMTAASIQTFFDAKALVVVAAKRKDVNGQCTKKDGDCRGQEVRDSFYNDMKTSMYLLGNAFRINQQKAPDNLPTVKAAKGFFKEMDAMERRVTSKKGAKLNDKESIGHYAAALDFLDEFLDLVELPPTDSGHYEQVFSREVGDTRIT